MIKYTHILSVLVLILVPVIFISNESFWIDEGMTHQLAASVDANTFLENLDTTTQSDPQMIGYIVQAWGWEKLVGNSEVLLRCLNLFWYSLIIFALRRKPVVLFLLIISPFFTYYLNEFRPYVMQVAGGAVVLGSIREKENDVSYLGVVIGMLIMCAASMLGFILSISVFSYFLIRYRIKEEFLSLVKMTLCFSPLFIGLLVYYLSLFFKGNSPTTMGGNPILSFAQVGYEFLGLSGVGPSRSALRESLGSAVAYIPQLTVCGVVLAGLAIASYYKSYKEHKRATLALSISVLIILACFTVLIEVKDFRLLGRHLSPFIVLIPLLYSSLFSGRWNANNKGGVKVMIFCCITAVFLWSSLSLRFSERHKKDDYRWAANEARDYIKEGKSVYWFANENTGLFYGLSPQYPGIKHFGPVSDLDLEVIDEGSVILCSKYDIYDGDGVLQNALKNGLFKIAHDYRSFKVMIPVKK